MDITGLEQKLWSAADKLRNNMDAAEYKHVVLGLIFLKYISDAFEKQRQKLAADQYSDPEERDFYTADNVFWVPKKARWENLQANAKQPEIGVLLDDAMDAIERENPSLRGVLPKNYARESLDKRRLGELIDTFSSIDFGEGHSSKDLLGRIYEYFIGMFADAEGKRGGQFYTPQSIVKLLVAMLEPGHGRIYDPCCGSGGMFVQSEKFVEAHQGRIGDIAVYGQESNQTTWRLAKMNMAIRGIDADIKFGDTLHNDQLPDLKADFVIANPPFNMSDWGGELLRNDARWKYGVPPTSNANFAWVQHFISHLAPNGVAGFVLADSSLTTANPDDQAVRKALVDANLVDCIVALPALMFTNTAITASLWFISRNRINRSGNILFIDAQGYGQMSSRRQRQFSAADIDAIALTYNNWKKANGSYTDLDGFSQQVSREEIEFNGYHLAPNTYVAKSDKFIHERKPGTGNINVLQLKEASRRIQLELSAIEEQFLPASIPLSKLLSIKDSALSLLEATDKASAQQFRMTILDKQMLLATNEVIDGWEVKTFGELFTERKLFVREIGYCPEILSVTNMGIQSREEKYTKELSKSLDNYKVAYFGDMVFGLSREIPNLDVLKRKDGAFSPAYSVYSPHDARIGIIIGDLMRMKLMQQTDLLKGGAREGRGLDKNRLKQKKYLLPSTANLDFVWGKLPSAERV